MTGHRSQLTGIRQRIHDLFEDERIEKVTSYLPPLNFITIHYAYFMFTCLLFSVIFWGSSNPSRSISYTDSLFLVVSAMTEAGLNTVNLSQMTTFQQVILWMLIVMGSAIYVSIFTVHTRKRAFERRFQYVVRAQREARRERKRSMSQTREVPVSERLKAQQKVDEPIDKSEFESRHSGPRDPTSGLCEGDSIVEKQQSGHVLAGGELEDETELKNRKPSVQESSVVGEYDAWDSITRADPVLHYAPSVSSHSNHRVLNFVGIGARPHSSAYRLPHSRNGLSQRRQSSSNIEAKITSNESLHNLHYPSYLSKDTVGRNGQFHDLTREEREHLGGVEYRAITLLAYIVPIYFVLWQLLGCLGLGAYMAHNKASVAEQNGINPWWLGVFNGASAFNNSGMSLLDANMIPFQTAVYPLLTMSVMILAGNTAYPLFLRLILWSMLRFLRFIYPSEDQYPDHKATIRFILQYPRRVYTNLFPSAPTWWLFFVIVCLNGIDWVAFEVLNIGNKAVEVIPNDFRVLDGLFQAVAVRSGGFYIIGISTLRIGLQVLYIIMMYISVYPVVITMRHSNIYEERSLGIYADDSSPQDRPSTPFSQLKRTFTSTGGFGVGKQEFTRHQIRAQLAHDLWLLILAVFFITIIETSKFDRDPVTYSVFNIMFEVVSGYGCVGISTGLPNEAYSFSGGWRTGSKLILVVVMLRGRHRSLPVALDKAVNMPGERLDGGEEEDSRLRRSLSVKRPEEGVGV